MVNDISGIVSERFLTVWDEFSRLVADSSREFFSAGDYLDWLVCTVADPWHFGVDPDPDVDPRFHASDPDPDRANFVIDLQDANNKIFFFV
jgi:hypothetical protein